MAQLFFIHWHEAEAQDKARPLQEAGHSVMVHFDSGEEAWRLLKSTPPDALVISLDRLPSHGRRVAAVTTETRRLRHVPVLFVGGEQEKVGAAKRQFPEAAFSDWFSLVQAVEATLAKRTPDVGSQFPFAGLAELAGIEPAPAPARRPAPRAPARARAAPRTVKRKKAPARRAKAAKAAPRAKKPARRKKVARAGEASGAKARSKKRAR